MIFQCKICYDNYNLTNKRPKLFGNCGHDVCCQCLEQMMSIVQKQHPNFENLILRCPFDNKDHFIKQGQDSKSFPNNNSIIEFLQQVKPKKSYQIQDIKYSYLARKSLKGDKKSKFKFKLENFNSKYQNIDKNLQMNQFGKKFDEYFQDIKLSNTKKKLNQDKENKIQKKEQRDNKKIPFERSSVCFVNYKNWSQNQTAKKEPFKNYCQSKFILKNNFNSDRKINIGHNNVIAKPTIFRLKNEKQENKIPENFQGDKFFQFFNDIKKHGKQLTQQNYNIIMVNSTVSNYQLLNFDQTEPMFYVNYH